MLGSKVSIRLAVYTRSFALARPAAILPTVALNSQRSYATPGRPKKAVGEPTKTVKRAVKRAAAEKDPKATKATKATKPKKAAKKPVKELTEEQKARAKAKVDKAKFRQLEELALQTPKEFLTSPRMTAWTVYNGEKVKEILTGSTGSDSDLAPVVKELARKYKELTAAEREHYNHIANERNKQKIRDYRIWVESHTPDSIHQANLARRKLRAKFPKKFKAYKNITDERVEKRPPGAYAIFVGERLGSGDFKGIGGGRQGTTLVAEEWRALTDGEKQKYTDSAAKLREEYDTRQAALEKTS